MKCNEAPEEPETKSKETLFQLSCFISQGGWYLAREKWYPSVCIVYSTNPVTPKIWLLILPFSFFAYVN